MTNLADIFEHRYPYPPGEEHDAIAYLRSIAGGISVLSSYSVLPRSLVSRKITVTTSPTLLINGTDIRPHVIMNPPPRITTGVVSEGTLLASQSSASGNTRSSALGVGRFVLASLFIAVTVAGSSTLYITPEALNPVTSNWVATANDIEITETGETYVYLGPVGITSQFALSWTTVGTAWTFSIGYSLKDSIGGTSVGGSNTVFLGNQNVTAGNWFPFIEGEITPYLPDENVDLYGISYSSVDVFIFDL